MEANRAELELVVAKFEALAENAVEAAQKDNLVTFLRHYFETTALEDLLSRKADELFAIALGHWQHAAQRSKNSSNV